MRFAFSVLATAMTFALGSSTSLSAQLPTAEETVAFIVMGVADNPELALYIPDGKVTREQISSSPARYELLAANPYEQTKFGFSVSQDRDCVYDITLEVLDQPEVTFRIEARLDFSGVWAIDDGRDSVSFEGLMFDCSPKTECRQFFDGNRFGGGTRSNARIKKAGAFFQDNFCPGAPF
ncbi:hypothetical protein [Martelella radicis]|uniref:Lipoprotein n=1 Tax=Martelella radicis TaxID=1397476 RepID=A0A7W6P9Q9_9HYPH|nr:hypothetical protein [Martelella radicis]MBB4122557.1 hypothetical protein [Martelella radicis]